MIKQLISYYWQLALFRESPANTPYSPLLMVLSALLLAAVMFVQWSFSNLDFSSETIMVITALSLAFSFIIYTYTLLALQDLGSRTIQTVTSLFCTHIIIHLFASPLFFIDPYLSQANLKNPLLLLVGVIYLFVTLGLSVWQFVVTAHIYKYALNTSAVQSVLAAFGLVAINILTVSFWR